MALLDRGREQLRFMKFKAAFRQTFAVPHPPFYGQNSSRDYESKEYGRERRSRKDRSASRSRDFRPRTRSPHHAKTRWDSSASPHGSRN